MTSLVVFFRQVGVVILSTVCVYLSVIRHWMIC
jgi:hypothetical protein